MEEVKAKTIFVVQHMEPYLFEWCMHEYLSMKKYLKGFNTQLWITNAGVIYQYHGDQQQQNKKHLKQLEEAFSEDKDKFKLVKQSLHELNSKLEGNVCMLDMRGQKELSSDESWNFIVFGGVLGDHPPRDRPAPIRKYFPNIRHLGSLQLATDTAVLMSRLILCNKCKLNDIPLVKQPTIKGLNKDGLKTTVQMEGFSYISREIDAESGKINEGLSKKQKKEIYMSEGVKKLLLKDDLDPQLLM